MSETRLQRKRRMNADFWGAALNGARKGLGANIIAEASKKNRQVERRKRAQFRHMSLPMTRPDWVPEALWEKAEAAWQEANMHSVHDAAPYGPYTIAIALLQAKNEGKREAAEIALSSMHADDDRLDKQCKHEVSQAILSSIEKELT